MEMDNITLVKDAFSLANVLLIPVLMYLHKTDVRLTGIEQIQNLMLKNMSLRPANSRDRTTDNKE